MLLLCRFVIDAVMKARISDVINFSGWSRQNERRPECHPAIGGSASGPVVYRLRINAYSGVRNALAPVHRCRLQIGRGTANDRVIAEWRHDTRPMLRSQPPELTSASFPEVLEWRDSNAIYACAVALPRSCSARIGSL